MAGPIFSSLGISLAIHAVLAVGLIVCLEYAPGPEILASLDLTRVELSFAEKVEESSPVAPVLSSPLSERQPKPKAEEKPPDRKFERREAPDALAARFPEPKEDPPEMKEAAPRQATIDAPAKCKRSIRPDYPRQSRLRGEQGDVTLEFEVAADGSVQTVRVVKSPGYALLEEAAVKAVRAAVFTPAKSGGLSVASTVRLTLDFRLR